MAKDDTRLIIARWIEIGFPFDNLMRGWGIMLIILGIGSYVLPLMGIQFMLVQLFGDGPWVGAGFIAVGAVLVVLGSRGEQSE